MVGLSDSWPAATGPDSACSRQRTTMSDGPNAARDMCSPTVYIWVEFLHNAVVDGGTEASIKRRGVPIRLDQDVPVVRGNSGGDSGE